MLPERYKVDFTSKHFDLVGKGLQRLLSQHLDKCVLRQFFAVFLQEAQDLYDACIDMQEQRTPYAAKGDILDALGRIVGADRLLWQYDDKSWFFYDRQGQGFDQVPVWCLKGPFNTYVAADDQTYALSILTKAKKNHTLTASAPEVIAAVKELFDFDISFEKMGPNRVRITVPSTISTTQLYLLTSGFSDLKVDDGRYVPFPATLDFSGVLMYVPGDFFIYDRDGRGFDQAPLAVGVNTEWRLE